MPKLAGAVIAGQLAPYAAMVGNPLVAVTTAAVVTAAVTQVRHAAVMSDAATRTRLAAVKSAALLDHFAARMRNNVVLKTRSAVLEHVYHLSLKLRPPELWKD